MRYRPLGRTGIVVSAVGFGAWGIGGHVEGGFSYGHTEDRDSLAALEAAFEAGITFYDTAPLYGHGHSETLIGRAFAGRRDRVVIATKAGHTDFASAPDFTPAAIRRSLEDSLRRLGTDYVDILQLHDPVPAELTGDIMNALADLRREGKIRAVGISAKSPGQGLEIMGRFPVAMLQVNFNLLDLRALDCGLFGRAAAEGVGLVARTPLCFGFLRGGVSGDEIYASEDHRTRWPAQQCRAWAEGGGALLDIAAAEEPGSGTVRALRFVLSFAAISTTIPGMLTRTQVAENISAGECAPFSDALLATLLKVSRSRDYFVRSPALSGGEHRV